MDSYSLLVNKFKEVFYFDKALGLLKWDTETYMPKGAFNLRAETIAVIEKYRNLILNDKANLDLLAEAYSKSDKLSPLEKKNLDLMKEEIEIASLLPFELRQNLIKIYAQLEPEWMKVKEGNDSKKLTNDFKILISLVKEKAEILSSYYNCLSYTALVKQYDPMITQVNLETSFNDLKAKSYEQRINRSSVRDFSMPIPDQERLIHKIIVALGFDSKYMNLSTTEHPFCDGSHEDVRIVISYDESDWTNTVFAAVHEMGHALYDRNLPIDTKSLLVGKDAGMTIHESQGLLFEFFLAKSYGFSEFLAKTLTEIKYNYSSLDIYNKLNETNKSLIRIESDRESYEKHILLRYEIERSLIESKMNVTDIEDYWNNFCHENFSKIPKSVDESWIQDIHWFLGYIGYFPCYYLGLTLAEQLWGDLTQDLSLISDMERGDFKMLRNYLNEKVYLKASLYEI